MEIGTLLVGKSESIPYGAFVIYREREARPFKEGDGVDTMETVMESEGSMGEAFVAIGIIIKELKEGRTVMFAVNENDDPKQWGIESISWEQE